MNTSILVQGLRRLPGGDRTLLRAFVTMAVLTLGLGLIYGALTAFTRAGFIHPPPELASRLLSLHGITVFFYWLYFAQAALVLVLSAVYTEGAERIAGRGLAWAGFSAMCAGLALSELMPALGLSVLYDGDPGLIGEARTQGGLFYAGYILLAAGLFLVGLAAIVTALRPMFAGRIRGWSSVSFAAVAWAGLLMVSAMAAINAFGPAALWAFGLAPRPATFTMSWHIMFHNVHYLPLMATVLLWYVLVETVTQVKSVFGPRFSKIVFSMYLIFVPPTSLYHMFLEPGLSEGIKVLGSLLSLFIGVPTVLVFLIIVVSLETHARAQGGRGLFGWLRMLPWGNPAMAAMGMAVVNLALGGALSFVLIQEKLAPLLSDTFMVPAYFHFLTLGTVTLTLIAVLLYVVPALTGRALWNPALLARLPYVMTAGLVVFGFAGVAAGLLGVPRRMITPPVGGWAPPAWEALMSAVGVGASLMALSLAGYVIALAWSLAGGRHARAGLAGELPAVSWGGLMIGRQSAWCGPLAVLVLIGAMYAFTAIGFELMESLPIVASGGHAGH